MRNLNKFLLFTIGALILTGCNMGQLEDVGFNNPYPSVAKQGFNFAKDNLDLQLVGNLLDRAENAEDFERLINTEGGVNNLDLDGDGYVDYLSVAEYDDRYPGQRGFVLFDSFGPNEIQEIVRIIFDREPNYNRGARVLLIGNEQIYGDNYYYETNNWRDRGLAIADWLFTDRQDYYYSPYYYNNYPDYYDTYQIVETPAYVSRVREYYYQPIFVETTSPTINIINIKSRYQGRTSERVVADLVKPTQAQIEYKQKNPNTEFIKIKNKEPRHNELREEKEFRKKQENSQGKFENRENREIQRSEKENRSGYPRQKDFQPNKPEKSERSVFPSEKPNKEKGIDRPLKQNKADNSGRENLKMQQPSHKDQGGEKAKGHATPGAPQGNGGKGKGKGKP